MCSTGMVFFGRGVEDPVHIEMKNIIQLGYIAVYTLHNQK